MGVFIWLIVKLIKSIQIKKTQSMLDQDKEVSEGKTQVMYFWSNQCNKCENIQKPILESIRELNTGADYVLKKINVIEEPLLAKKWAVKTVPTICIINKTGDLQYFNNGLVSENKLREQLGI